jgi:hypothetical protein
VRNRARSLAPVARATASDAKAKHNGAFVWADSSSAEFTSTSLNEFCARATGGVRFVMAIDWPSGTRRMQSTGRNDSLAATFASDANGRERRERNENIEFPRSARRLALRCGQGVLRGPGRLPCAILERCCR